MKRKLPKSVNTIRCLVTFLAFGFVNAWADDGVSLTDGKTADGEPALTVKHPGFTLEIFPSQGGKGVQ